jgi:hypothetical protein
MDKFIVKGTQLAAVLGLTSSETVPDDLNLLNLCALHGKFISNQHFLAEEVPFFTGLPQV